ncbi:MAG: helix-turn-helix transcriptional regulator [Clostridia bacterium]|nr:helix-turn-helix transcriptional regulator [Clostridia bacterium]
MKDVKPTIAKNLVMLRKQMGLTQIELAEKFNYSDKAVCRWECGDTLPDINVLSALCAFYGITLNDLTDEDFYPDSDKSKEKYMRAYRVGMCILLCTSVWLLATVAFVYSLTLSSVSYWLAFIWAVPISCFIIFRSLRRMLNMVGKIIVTSLLSWSLITTLYLHMLIHSGANVWYIFLVGIPLQAFIVQLFAVRKYKEKL